MRKGKESDDVSGLSYAIELAKIFKEACKTDPRLATLDLSVDGFNLRFSRETEPKELPEQPRLKPESENAT